MDHRQERRSLASADALWGYHPTARRKPKTEIGDRSVGRWPLGDDALDDQDPCVVAACLGAPAEDLSGALVGPAVEDLTEDAYVAGVEWVVEDLPRNDFSTAPPCERRGRVPTSGQEGPAIDERRSAGDLGHSPAFPLS
jgi:hypothetical protein